MSLRPRPGFRIERKPLFAEQSERTSEVTTIFPKRQNVRRIRKRPAASPAQVPLRPPDGRPPRPFRKKDYMKPATFALSYNDLNRITNLRLPCKKAERPPDTSPKNRRSADRTRTTVNNRPERPTSKPTTSEKTGQRRLASHPQFTRNDFFRPFFPDTRQTAITETQPALPHRFRPDNRFPRTRLPARSDKKTKRATFAPASALPSPSVRRIRYTPSRMSSRFPRRNFPRHRSAPTKTEECAGSGTLLCFCRTSEAVTRTPRR